MGYAGSPNLAIRFVPAGKIDDVLAWEQLQEEVANAATPPTLSFAHGMDPHGMEPRAQIKQ